MSQPKTNNLLEWVNMKRTRKKTVMLFFIVLFVVIVFFVYVCFWPMGKPVKSFTAPINQGFTGQFEENNLLGGMKMLSISPYTMPETVIYHDGYLYASGNTSGLIVRVREDGSDLRVVLDTHGAILGFDFDKNGYLYFCDTMYEGKTAGIYKADISNIPAATELVCDSIGGQPLSYPDALTIASDGTIYFTDATIFAPLKYTSNDAAADREWWFHTNSGRVLAYNPKTDEGNVVAVDLCFPNGIQLSSDEKNLFVNETYEYSIWKIAVSCRNATKGEQGYSVLLNNLPGLPDNLCVGMDGRYWVGLVDFRNGVNDNFLADGFYRAITMRLPFLLPVGGEAKGVTYVFAFTDDGRVVKCLQATEPDYNRVTGIEETEDHLYLQSNCAIGSIGYIDKSIVGLK
jgi:sugar lactone lactonase YvrE